MQWGPCASESGRAFFGVQGSTLTVLDVLRVGTSGVHTTQVLHVGKCGKMQLVSWNLIRLQGVVSIFARVQCCFCKIGIGLAENYEVGTVGF